MSCRNCGSKIGRGWKYCPNCGMEQGGSQNDVFSQAFRQMEEVTRRMGADMKMDMEVIDLSKLVNEVAKSMASPSRNGISIRIHQKDNQKPEISVGRLGQESRTRAIFPNLRKPTESKSPKAGLKLPKCTEEPATETKMMGNKVYVDIKLPGVISAGDIDLKEMESSIEVKALAGNRGYFKIIRKPEFSRIAKKQFENGVLKIEIL